MAKIAFIGAGNLVFARKLCRDILTLPLLKGSTLTLMDTDAECLHFARRAVRRIVDPGSYPATVVTTMDRTEAPTNLEEMAAEAALASDPPMLCQAIAHDPLTAMVLSLAEIKRMVTEMLRQNESHLAQFVHVEL